MKKPGKMNPTMNNKLCAAFLIILAVSIFGCQPNPAIMNTQKRVEEPAATPSDNSKLPQDEFEFALRRMQKSGFTYIFVMRRKDGGTIDKEDGRFIKQISPPGTNQFVLTDNDRAVIVGSNFPFPPENIEALRQKLSVEDFSPNENVNTNQNNN